MNILIVDDDFVSRKKMNAIMSQYGRCDTAVDGDECMDAFVMGHNDGAPYDIITMDIEMPGMDGIETVKKIRDWEESRDIPLGNGAKIIMVTVKWDSKALLSSFKEGCEAYVVKPFDRDKIEKALKILGVDLMK